MSFVGDLVKRLDKRLSDNQKKSGWGQTQATQSTGQVAKPNGSGTTTNKKTGKTTSNWGRKDTSYQGTGRANKTVEQKNTPVQTQKRIQNTQKGYTPTKEQTVGDIANSIKSDAKKAYDTVKKKVDQQPKSNWGRTDANYQGTASQNIVSQQDIKANVNKTRKEAGQAIKQNRFDQYKEAARKNIKEQKEKPASISDNFKKIENNAKETAITTTTGNKSYNYEGRKNTKEGLAKTKEEADKQYEEATKTLEENPALNAVAQGVRHLANVGRAFNQGLVGSVNGDVQTVAAGLQGLGKITGNRALEEYGRNAVIQGNQVMDEMQKQETEENPFSATWLGQQTVNAGNNFVGALSSALTGGASQAAGLIPMGISVAGQSYGKALDQLTNDDGQMSRDDYIRALAYAVLNTVKEVGTEKYDPLSKMVPGRTPKSVSDVIGEGLEEVTGGMLEPYIEQILNTNNTNPLEVLQAGFKDKTGDLSQYALDQLNNFVGGVFLPAVQGGVAYGVNPTVGVDQNTGKEVKYRQVVNDDVRRSLQAAKDYQDYRQNKVLTKANQAASKISGNANQVKQSAFIQRYWNTESLTSNNNEVRMNAQVANRDVILQQAEDIGLDKKTAQNVAKAANKAGVVVDLVKSDKQFENQSQGFIDEDGTLHIRVGKDVDPVEQIVVHELTHATEGTDEYEKLKKAVFKMHDKGQLKGTLDYDSLSENEKVATLTTEALGNENSLKALASRNQGLGSWILDRVKSIATGTTPGMNKIERILNNAMLANPEQVQGRLAEEYTNNNAAKLKKGDTIKSNSGTEWTVDKVSTKKNSKGKVTDVTITASRYDKYTGQTVTEEMKPADIKNKVNTSLETASKEKKLKPAEQKAYKEFWGDYGIGVELQEEFDEVGSKDFTDREIWDAYRSVVDGKKENLTEAESIVKDYLDDSYGLSDGEFQDEYDPANFEESEQAKLDLTQDNAESGNQNTENEVEPVENQPVLPENSKLDEENTDEPAETNQVPDQVQSEENQVPEVPDQVQSNESNESNESSTEETENQGENSGKLLANTNEEESASEDYNIGDLVNNLRTIHNGAKANQEQAMQNAEAQAKADTETWQKNTEEAINEVGKGAITPEEFNKKADAIAKANTSTDINELSKNTGDMLQTSMDSNSENQAKASEAVEQALASQMPDVDDETKKKITSAEVKTMQGYEKRAEGKGDSTHAKTSKQAKSDVQTKIENNSDEVNYKQIKIDNLTFNSKQKYGTTREQNVQAIKDAVDYVGELPNRGLTKKSRQAFETKRAEISQVYQDCQYYEGQLEEENTQLANKFKKGKNQKGEYYLSGRSLKFSNEDSKWHLYDKEGNIIADNEIGIEQKKVIAQMNDNVHYRDELLSKINGWSNISGTLLRLSRPELNAVSKMSPAGRKAEIMKGIQQINDIIKSDYASDWKKGTKIELTEAQQNLVEQISQEDDLKKRNQMTVQLQKDIANQMPTKLLDRLDAWRYTALLSAPITAVRNVVGNTGSAFMYKMTDFMDSFVENYFKARGEVRYNGMDFSSSEGKQAFTNASQYMDNVYDELYQNAKKSGNIKNYLKGIDANNSSELSKVMGKWKSSSFNLNDSDHRNFNRAAEQFAWHLQDNGYTYDSEGHLVDTNGNEVSLTDKNIQQMAIQSYHEATHSLIDSSSLISSSATEGDYSRSKNTRADRKAWRKFQDALTEGAVENKYMDRGTKEGQAFANGVLEYHGRNALGTKNPARWLSDVENYVLNDSQITGDKGAMGRRIASNMARYISAQGYTIDGTYEDNYTPKLIDSEGNEVSRDKADGIIAKGYGMASADAAESTFHDSTALSEWLNSGKQKSRALKVAIDAVQPFIGVPNSILHRTVEFSPIGLVSSVTYGRYQVMNGEISGETFVRRIGQGMTGTMLAGLGAWLLKEGILRAKGDDDDDDDNEKSFKESNGQQDYSLILPNGDSVSLEWAAPATTPLLFGAQAMDVIRKMTKGQMNTDQLLETALSVIEPIADASYVSGLAETIGSLTGNSKYGDSDSSGVYAAVKTVFKNYVRQFFPNEGGKLLQAVSGKKFSTYDDNFFGGVARSALSNMFVVNMAYKGITGNYMLEPQVDTSGNEIGVENYGIGAAGRFLTTHAIPWTYKRNTYSNDQLNSELLRLYDATGKENDYLLPRNLSRISNPDNLKFTPEQRTKYNKEYLGNMRKQMESFINSPMYDNYSDEDKAKILGNIQQLYYYKAKKEYFDEIGADSSAVLSDTSKNALACEKLGVDPYRFYAYRTIQPAQDEYGNDITNSSQMYVRQQMEASGDYDKIVKAYMSGKITKLSSVGLNNKVGAWTEAHFQYEMDLLNNGMLTSGESKKESNPVEDFKEDFEEGQKIESLAKNYGIDPTEIYRNQDIPTTNDPNTGKPISNSGYLDARYKAMQNGTWDTIKAAVANGEMTEKEAQSILGVGKQVFEQKDSSFWKAYNKLQFQKQLIESGEYNADDFKKGGKYYKKTFGTVSSSGEFGVVGSGSGSGRSSGRGSGRSSGKSSGGSSGGTSINKIFKKADRERLLGLVSGLGMSTDYVVNAHGATKDVDPGGFEISNSDDAKVRQVAQADGTWKKIQDAVANGTMTEKDACTILGVSRKVFEMSDDDFSALLRKIEKRKQGMTDAEINAEEKARKKSANFFGNYLKKSSRSTSASFNPSSDSAMSAWNSVMSTHKKNVKSTAKSVGLS